MKSQITGVATLRAIRRGLQRAIYDIECVERSSCILAKHHPQCGRVIDHNGIDITEALTREKRQYERVLRLLSQKVAA